MAGKKLLESAPSYPRKSWVFYCPGCDCCHAFITARPPGEEGFVWTFNRSLENPTFSPSLLVQSPGHKESGRPPIRCHLYLKNGRIEYLTDCSHALAGITVDMKEVP
jgi:hypothetical protein